MLAVFAGGDPDIAAANVDVTKGYDNSFARPRSDAWQGAMGRRLRDDDRRSIAELARLFRVSQNTIRRA